MQLRGRVTARALAERFEVSTRTILRDMDELSAAGVPVYAERGVNGGFTLLDGFRTDLTGLDSAEREAMFLVGLPHAATDLGLDRPAASARLKLAAAVGSGDSGIADRFHLDPNDWYRRGKPAPHLRAVAEAVWNGRRLSMDYESWWHRAWRTLDPLGLVLKAGEWYLVANGARGPAIYRLATVHGVSVLDEAVSRPAGFDLAKCWADLARRFESARLTASATIKVRPGAMDRIDRLGASAAERIRTVEPDEDGARVARIPFDSVAHDSGLLLGFADDIEVLEPEILRAKVAELATSAAAQYR